MFLISFDYLYVTPVSDIGKNTDHPRGTRVSYGVRSWVVVRVGNTRHNERGVPNRVKNGCGIKTIWVNNELVV